MVEGICIDYNEDNKDLIWQFQCIGVDINVVSKILKVEYIRKKYRLFSFTNTFNHASMERNWDASYGKILPVCDNELVFQIEVSDQLR